MVIYLGGIPVVKNTYNKSGTATVNEFTKQLVVVYFVKGSGGIQHGNMHRRAIGNIVSKKFFKKYMHLSRALLF